MVVVFQELSGPWVGDEANALFLAKNEIIVGSVASENFVYAITSKSVLAPNGTIVRRILVWNYNLTTKTWTKVQCEQPVVIRNESQRFCSFELHENYIFTFGGEFMQPVTHFCAFDSLNNTWCSRPCNGDRPRRQFVETMVVNNDDVYVVGRTTVVGAHGIDVFRVNLTDPELEWHRVTVLPKHVFNENQIMELIFFDDKLILFGIHRGDYGEYFEHFDVFNVVTKQWSVLTTLADLLEGFPKPTPGYSVKRHGHFVYLTCGNRRHQVWMLDLRSCGWTKLDVKIPITFEFQNTSLDKNGCMYVLGSQDDRNIERRRCRLLWFPMTAPTLARLPIETANVQQFEYEMENLL